MSACRYCLTAERLKRTLMTAVIVGTVLTLLNQADVIATGEATSTTFLKCAANYLVPFIVSNVGMLIGRGTSGQPPGGGGAAAPAECVPVVEDADGRLHVLL